jgi:hemoglobin/transferrin/lactoferrin receptor protein
MNNLSITHAGSNAIYDQLSVRLAYQFFEESRIDRDLNQPTRFIRKEQVHAISANADFLKTIRKRHSLFYGLEFASDEVESSGIDEDIETGAKAVGSSRYPQATWSSYAAYMSYLHKFSDQFLIQAGARYNIFRLDADFTNNLAFFPFPFETAEINNGALTGSLGLVLTPSEEWTVSMNASTGFRSPNVDDVGKVFDSSPGSVFVPNPDLDAEYAYNVDIDVAKVFGSVARIDVTGYYTLLDNALVRRNFTLNGMDSILYEGELSQVEAIQNAATARVLGIQAGIELKLGGGFTVATRFNYQDGEEELDDGSTSPLRHAAPWFGMSRLSFASDEVDLQLYTLYSGEVTYENLPEEGRATPYIFAIDENGNPYSPDWITLNFKAAIPISDAFTVSGGVENILDMRYRPYSSGLVAAGRNVILSVRAKF